MGASEAPLGLLASIPRTRFGQPRCRFHVILVQLIGNNIQTSWIYWYWTWSLAIVWAFFRHKAAMGASVAPPFLNAQIYKGSKILLQNWVLSRWKREGYVVGTYVTATGMHKYLLQYIPLDQILFLITINVIHWSTIHKIQISSW